MRPIAQVMAQDQLDTTLEPQSPELARGGLNENGNNGSNREQSRIRKENTKSSPNRALGD